MRARTRARQREGEREEEQEKETFKNMNYIVCRVLLLLGPNVCMS